MAKAKTLYEASNRNGPGSLISDTSLWQVLRFVAHWFKQSEDNTHITIYRTKK